MQINSIGVIGHGHFGQFVVTLVERFVPEATIKVYSRRGVVGQGLYCSLEDAAASDIVIMCGGIAEYETQLASLLPHLGEQTILVDVATVKKYTTELFRTTLIDRSWVSCHPMFGAESYKKTAGDVTGYRIVITDTTLPDTVMNAVQQFLEHCGFTVITMTADEHDQLLAETLFMTHYVGQVMQTAGFARTTIDTVSFASLMSAVESVAQDTQLFRDVYQYNSYCAAVVQRFHQAQQRVLNSLPGSNLEK